MMSMEFVSLFRKYNEDSTIVRASLNDLLAQLGLDPSYARIYHILDIFEVEPDMTVKLGVKVNFNYRKYTKNILDVVTVRQAIAARGVIHPILIAVSRDRNIVWVLDGGTRIETIDYTTVVDWKIINVDPLESPMHAFMRQSPSHLH